MVPVNPMQQPFPAGQTDRLFTWTGGADGAFADTGSPTLNSFTAMMSPTGPYGPAVPAPSTALARRQTNRALIPSTVRPQFDSPPEPWNNFGEDPSYLHNSGPMDEHDSLERLEERAQRAKREAQAKRKQIPPFVQKLSR